MTGGGRSLNSCQDTTYLFAPPCTSGNEVCGRVRATTRDRPCAPTSGLSEGCPRHPRTGASPALRLHELGGLIRRIVGLTLAVNLAVRRGPRAACGATQATSGILAVNLAVGRGPRLLKL